MKDRLQRRIALPEIVNRLSHGVTGGGAEPAWQQFDQPGENGPRTVRYVSGRVKDDVQGGQEGRGFDDSGDGVHGNLAEKLYARQGGQLRHHEAIGHEEELGVEDECMATRFHELGKRLMKFCYLITVLNVYAVVLIHMTVRVDPPQQRCEDCRVVVFVSECHRLFGGFLSIILVGHSAA